MRIEYSPELRDYMAKKGFKDISIGVYHAHCCSATPGLDVRPLSATEADELRGRGAHCLHGELGDVFVGRQKLPPEEPGAPEGVLHLGLKSFLGAKDITVKGLLVEGVR